MTRPYELRERAARMEETRRRIVAATAALHAEVGPARTTIAAIAERAGVSRPTVYAQFPDERDLFAACSAHFQELHPPPDIGQLPLEQGLARLYGHYAENRRTLAHVERDERLLPALAEVRRPAAERLDRVASDHANALDAGPEARLVIRLALEFATWERLDAEGLSPDDAAALMARLARCAGTAVTTGAGAARLPARRAPHRVP